jgi:DNA replication protein DnaC
MNLLLLQERTLTENGLESGAAAFGLQRRYFGACLVNWIASEAVKERVIEWMNNPEHFIVLMGSTGTGKTYFCASLLNYLYEFKGRRSVYYITARHFFQHLQNSINEGHSAYSGIEKFKDQNILIVDDIGAGRTTEWQQEMLLELIDSRYNSMLPTVFTTNLDFKKIKEELGFRIFSRLGAKENVHLEFWESDRRLQ